MRERELAVEWAQRAKEWLGNEARSGGTRGARQGANNLFLPSPQIKMASRPVVHVRALDGESTSTGTLPLRESLRPPPPKVEN